MGRGVEHAAVTSHAAAMLVVRYYYTAFDRRAMICRSCAVCSLTVLTLLTQTARKLRRNPRGS